MLKCFGEETENILIRAAVEGDALSSFMARRVRQLHDQNPSETHRIFKKFFYGSVECGLCRVALGTAVV